MLKCLLPVAALAAAACSGSPPPGAGSAVQVRTVYDGCVAAMVKSACVAMNDKSPPPTGDVVLVAGVGPVDARAYRALREAGEGMCAHVQASCGTQWEGAPCRTARALWGGADLKPR